MEEVKQQTDGLSEKAVKIQIFEAQQWKARLSRFWVRKGYEKCTEHKTKGIICEGCSAKKTRDIRSKDTDDFKFWHAGKRGRVGVVQNIYKNEVAGLWK